jgi:DNA-binding NtrC family response regulator
MKPEQMLTGDSDALAKLRREIQKTAVRRDNILIEGERGSGRSTVARLVHALSSPRADLVQILPHGASDEAVAETLAKMCNGATLLVPDAADLPYVQQAMIAGALHGAAGKRTPRAILTVAGDLDDATESKALHPVLAALAVRFHRITVPPLSKRVSDIPLLAEEFVKAAAAAANSEPKVIKPATEDFLKRRTWKGNIRELKAVVERAAMESEGAELELPTELIDEASQLRGILSNIADRTRFSFDKSLSNLEKTLIERALREVSANQSHAAEILNLSEANLRYRMKKFRIRGGF